MAPFHTNIDQFIQSCQGRKYRRNDDLLHRYREAINRNAPASYLIDISPYPFTTPPTMTTDPASTDIISAASVVRKLLFVSNNGITPAIDVDTFARLLNLGIVEVHQNKVSLFDWVYKALSRPGAFPHGWRGYALRHFLDNKNEPEYLFDAGGRVPVSRLLASGILIPVGTFLVRMDDWLYQVLSLATAESEVAPPIPDRIAYNQSVNPRRTIYNSPLTEALIENAGCAADIVRQLVESGNTPISLEDVKNTHSDNLFAIRRLQGLGIIGEDHCSRFSLNSWMYRILSGQDDIDCNEWTGTIVKHLLDCENRPVKLGYMGADWVQDALKRCLLMEVAPGAVAFPEWVYIALSGATRPIKSEPDEDADNATLILRFMLSSMRKSFTVDGISRGCHISWEGVFSVLVRMRDICLVSSNDMLYSLPEWVSKWYSRSDDDFSVGLDGLVSGDGNTRMHLSHSGVDVMWSAGILDSDPTESYFFTLKPFVYQVLKRLDADRAQPERTRDWVGYDQVMYVLERAIGDGSCSSLYICCEIGTCTIESVEVALRRLAEMGFISQSGPFWSISESYEKGECGRVLAAAFSAGPGGIVRVNLERARLTEDLDYVIDRLAAKDLVRVNQYGTVIVNNWLLKAKKVLGLDDIKIFEDGK